MVERIEGIKVRVTIDTNKQTIDREWRPQGDETLPMLLRRLAKENLYDEAGSVESSAAPSLKEQLRGRVAVLSVREREVIALIISGASNEQTGKLLHISTKTVETHRARINKKLGAHATHDLFRICFLAELLEPRGNEIRLKLEELTEAVDGRAA